MQNFIVLEITRNAQGNIAVYPSAKETQNSAEKKFYEILGRAVDSQAPVHGAYLMTYDGLQLDKKFYFHEPTPPEPEPTPDEPTETSGE